MTPSQPLTGFAIALLSIAISGAQSVQVHFPDDAMARDLGIYDAQLNIRGSGTAFCDPKLSGTDDYPNYGSASFGKILRTVFPKHKDGSYIVTQSSVSEFRIDAALHLFANIANITADEALKGDPKQGLRHPMFALREGTSELMLFTKQSKAFDPKFYAKLSALHDQETAFMTAWENAPAPPSNGEKTEYAARMSKIQFLISNLTAVSDR